MNINNLYKVKTCQKTHRNLIKNALIIKTKK